MKQVSDPQKHRTRVLVTGGRGFIGRHVVRHLELRGARTVIGTRSPAQDPAHRERLVAVHELVTAADCEPLLNDIDVVINSAGILRQQGRETYERVHHHGVAALARACASKGIRFIHVSILGVDAPVTSRFTLSKRRGEAAIRRCGGDWTIVRPSLVDGQGGYGARWFRRAARWPVHFTPANATGGFTPIDADDLGEAIACIALANAKIHAETIIELGGERILTVPEYLALLTPDGMNKPVVRVPGVVCRLISHCCDVLRVTPFSFGHYELLRHANYPARNSLRTLLGRDPKFPRHETDSQKETDNEKPITAR